MCRARQASHAPSNITPHLSCQILSVVYSKTCTVPLISRAEKPSSLPSPRGAPRTGLPVSTYPAGYYERHLARRTSSPPLVLPEMPVPRRRLDRNPASAPPMPRQRNSGYSAELSHWTNHSAAPGMGAGAGLSAIRPRLPGRYSKNNSSCRAGQASMNTSDCQSTSGVHSGPNYHGRYALAKCPVVREPSGPGMPPTSRSSPQKPTAMRFIRNFLFSKSLRKMSCRAYQAGVPGAALLGVGPPASGPP